MSLRALYECTALCSCHTPAPSSPEVREAVALTHSPHTENYLVHPGRAPVQTTLSNSATTSVQSYFPEAEVTYHLGTSPDRRA